MLDPNLTFLEPRAHQHRLRPQMRHLTQSLRVRDRLNLMKKLQIGEIVDEDLLDKNHDDPVAAEADAFDF